MADPRQPPQPTGLRLGADAFMDYLQSVQDRQGQAAMQQSIEQWQRSQQPPDILDRTGLGPDAGQFLRNMVGAATEISPGYPDVRDIMASGPQALQGQYLPALTGLAGGLLGMAPGTPSASSLRGLVDHPQDVTFDPTVTSHADLKDMTGGLAVARTAPTDPHQIRQGQYPLPEIGAGRATGKPFYSKLQQTIEGGAETARADQYLAWLMKQPGVKVQELNESAVGKWLEDAGNRKIYKNELLHKLEDAPIFQMEEKWLTDDPAIIARNPRGSTGVSRYESFAEEGGENYRELLFKQPGIDYEAPHFRGDAEGLIAHARMTDRSVAQPKVTPGGAIRGIDEWPNDMLFIEELQSDLHQAARSSKHGYGGASATELREMGVLRDRHGATINTMQGQIASYVDEMSANKWPEFNPETDYLPGRAGVKNPNWRDQMDARTSLKDYIMTAPRQFHDSGEHSVQHQLERLVSQSAPFEKAAMRRDLAQAILDDPAVLRDLQVTADRAQVAYLEYDSLGNRISAGKKGLPGEALLKSNYREAMIKRLLTQAAHEDKDWVGLTTGNMQKERYDLGQVADTLEYDGDTLIAYQNGQEVYNEYLKPDELADHVGEDAAQQLREGNYARPSHEDIIENEMESAREMANDDFSTNQEGDEWVVTDASGDEWGRFDDEQAADNAREDMVERQAQSNAEYLAENDEYYNDPSNFGLDVGDLEMGGHGMAELYDRIIPNEIKKVAKTLDKMGAKLDYIEVEGMDEEVLALRLTDTMKKKLREEGTAVYNINPSGGGAPRAPRPTMGGIGQNKGAVDRVMARAEQDLADSPLKSLQDPEDRTVTANFIASGTEGLSHREVDQVARVLADTFREADLGGAAYGRVMAQRGMPQGGNVDLRVDQGLYERDPLRYSETMRHEAAHVIDFRGKLSDAFEKIEDPAEIDAMLAEMRNLSRKNRPRLWESDKKLAEKWANPQQVLDEREKITELFADGIAQYYENANRAKMMAPKFTKFVRDNWNKSEFAKILGFASLSALMARSGLENLPTEEPDGQ